MSDEFVSQPFVSSRTKRATVPQPLLKYDLLDTDDTYILNIKPKGYTKKQKTDKTIVKQATNRFAGEIPDNIVPAAILTDEQIQQNEQNEINEQQRQAAEQLHSTFTDTTHNNNTNNSNTTYTDLLIHNPSYSNIPVTILNAVQSQIYGKLTQIVTAWQPNTILCKRFNVPVPTVTAQYSNNNTMFDTQFAPSRIGDINDLDTQFTVGETIQPNVQPALASVQSTAQVTIDKPAVVSGTMQSVAPIDVIEVSDSETPIDLTAVDDNDIETINTDDTKSNVQYPAATKFLQTLNQSHTTQPTSTPTVNELQDALNSELQKLKHLRHKSKRSKHKKKKRHKHKSSSSGSDTDNSVLIIQ